MIVLDLGASLIVGMALTAILLLDRIGDRRSGSRLRVL